MPENFKKVHNNLFRGGAPTKQDLQILSDNFGIDRIISLDDVVANEIYPMVNNLGMEHIIIPLTGSEKNKTRGISFLLKNIVKLLNQDIPTYIHCRHGSDRTGLAIALFRVLNDGWDSNDAINEAKEHQFGQRMSAEAKKFYSDLICDETDSSDTYDNDIVQSMRDWFEMGAAAPAYPPQQSWAPENDIKFKTDEDLLDNFPPEHADHSYFSANNKYPSKNRKREMRKLLMDGMAQVGTYDNYEGIRGTGWGQDTGGFAYPEGDGVPSGAGISETNGYHNL